MPLEVSMAQNKEEASYPPRRVWKERVKAGKLTSRADRLGIISRIIIVIFIRGSYIQCGSITFFDPLNKG